MKAQPITARGLALLLSLSLGFPPGASALRPTGLEESDSAKEKLLESLTDSSDIARPAAGLEEPPVVSTITRFFRFPTQLDWLLAQMTPKVEGQEPVVILCLGSGAKEPASIASSLWERYGEMPQGRVVIHAVDSNDGVYQEMLRHFEKGEAFDLFLEADSRPGIGKRLIRLNETMLHWRQWIKPVHSSLENVRELYFQADAVFLNMVAYQVRDRKKVRELLAQLKEGARIYTRSEDAQLLDLKSDSRFYVLNDSKDPEWVMVFQRAGLEELSSRAGRLDAELKRLASEAEELQWLRDFLREEGITLEDPSIRFGIHLGSSVLGSSSPPAITHLYNRVPACRAPFAKARIRLISIPRNTTEAELPEILRAIEEHPRIVLVTATQPHKIKVGAWVNRWDPQELPATNVLILRDPQGKLLDVRGTNSDGPGFVEQYKKVWGARQGRIGTFEGKKVVLLGGWGGLGQALTTSVLKEKPLELIISEIDHPERTLEQSRMQFEEMLDRFSSQGGERLNATILRAYDPRDPSKNDPELLRHIREAEIIINATGLGMEKNDHRSPLTDPSVLGSQQEVFDSIYRTKKGEPRPVTPFLQQAWDAGVRRVFNGVGLYVRDFALEAEWLVRELTGETIQRDPIHEEMYHWALQNRGLKEARDILSAGLEEKTALGRHVDRMEQAIKERRWDSLGDFSKELMEAAISVLKTEEAGKDLSSFWELDEAVCSLQALPAEGLPREEAALKILRRWQANAVALLVTTATLSEKAAEGFLKDPASLEGHLWFVLDYLWGRLRIANMDRLVFSNQEVAWEFWADAFQVLTWTTPPERFDPTQIEVEAIRRTMPIETFPSLLKAPTLGPESAKPFFVPLVQQMGEAPFFLKKDLLLRRQAAAMNLSAVFYSFASRVAGELRLEQTRAFFDRQAQARYQQAAGGENYPWRPAFQAVVAEEERKNQAATLPAPKEVMWKVGDRVAMRDPFSGKDRVRVIDEVDPKNERVHLEGDPSGDRVSFKILSRFKRLPRSGLEEDGIVHLEGLSLERVEGMLKGHAPQALTFFWDREGKPAEPETFPWNSESDFQALARERLGQGADAILYAVTIHRFPGGLQVGSRLTHAAVAAYRGSSSSNLLHDLSWYLRNVVEAYPGPLEKIVLVNPAGEEKFMPAAFSTESLRSWLREDFRRLRIPREELGQWQTRLKVIPGSGLTPPHLRLTVEYQGTSGSILEEARKVAQAVARRYPLAYGGKKLLQGYLSSDEKERLKTMAAMARSLFEMSQRSQRGERIVDADHAMRILAAAQAGVKYGLPWLQMETVERYLEGRYDLKRARLNFPRRLEKRAEEILKEAEKLLKEGTRLSGQKTLQAVPKEKTREAVAAPPKHPLPSSPLAEAVNELFGEDGKLEIPVPSDAAPHGPVGAAGGRSVAGKTAYGSFLLKAEAGMLENQDPAVWREKVPAARITYRQSRALISRDFPWIRQVQFRMAAPVQTDWGTLNPVLFPIHDRSRAREMAITFPLPWVGLDQPGPVRAVLEARLPEVLLEEEADARTDDSRLIFATSEEPSAGLPQKWALVYEPPEGGLKTSGLEERGIRKLLVFAPGFVQGAIGDAVKKWRLDSPSTEVAYVEAKEQVPDNPQAYPDAVFIVVQDGSSWDLLEKLFSLAAHGVPTALLCPPSLMNEERISSAYVRVASLEANPLFLHVEDGLAQEPKLILTAGQVLNRLDFAATAGDSGMDLARIRLAARKFARTLQEPLGSIGEGLTKLRRITNSWKEKLPREMPAEAEGALREISSSREEISRVLQVNRENRPSELSRLIGYELTSAVNALDLVQFATTPEKVLSHLPTIEVSFQHILAVLDELQSWEQVRMAGDPFFPYLALATSDTISLPVGTYAYAVAGIRVVLGPIKEDGGETAGEKEAAGVETTAGNRSYHHGQKPWAEVVNEHRQVTRLISQMRGWPLEEIHAAIANLDFFAAGLSQKGAPVYGPPKGGLETSGLEEGVLGGVMARMPDPKSYSDVEKWLDAVHGPAPITGYPLADDVAWGLLARNYDSPEGKRSAFWKQLAEEVSGKAGQLKPLEVLWLAEIFEHLTKQYVPEEGRGAVAEILDLVVKRRIPEAAENVRFEEVKGFEFPDTLPGFLLEKEGLRFAPLFALMRARMGRIKMPPFAGVVETKKEKAALIEILSISDKMLPEERAQVVEAKRILRRMIQSAESFGGGEKGYEEATRLAESMLLGLVLTPIKEAEPNLLRQLNQLLGRFGYRLSPDRATQEAALILLYAA
ncbi:MAG: hypothetical protein HYS41_00310 [Candidatus Omnitrophica bacterium]|nr:hypothetical protein [Candidatus Omnitrophota bacterium]